MERKAKKNPVSVKNVMGYLLGGFLFMILLMMAVMIRNIREVREIAYECIENKTAIYVELIGKDIDNLSAELLAMLVRDNKELLELPDTITPQESRYYKLLKDIRDDNFTRKTVYEYTYSFFEYVDSADFLILDSSVYFSTSRIPASGTMLKERLKEAIEGAQQGIVWDMLKADGTAYLFGFIQQDGKAVGCMASLDDMFAEIDITNLGYEGIPFFEKDGQVYLASENQDREDIMNLIRASDRSALTNDYAFYRYTLKRVGNLEILILFSNGVLDRISGVQTLLLLIYLILVALALWILVYFYQRILKPMRMFVSDLKNPEKEKFLNDTSKKSVVELEYASEKFREQFRELQSLRISLYEQELQVKKTELEYMQEQIRPHFYLNCLSIIQGMAEMHQEEEIMRITEILSNYMCYVMNDSSAFRYVRDEVHHIQNYVDIQQIRKPEKFRYEVIAEDNVRDVQIPPLILQPFVENSISHALRADSCIDITLYLTLGESNGVPMLYVTISDTGPGFPSEVLNALNCDEPIIFDGRKHIGIANTIRRLEIVYGGKAGVRLSNMAEHYGAVVEISIPVESGKRLS
ncbi:MAG: histidine kinase [Lachnospiraceae bacterium]|nr:histidine kinase [Lachnospiraceae bacterium]